MSPLAIVRRQSKTTPVLKSIGLWLILLFSPAMNFALHVANGAVPNTIAWFQLAIVGSVLLLGLFVPAAILYRRVCALSGAMLASGLLAQAVAPATRMPFQQQMLDRGLLNLATSVLVLFVAWCLCGRSLAAVYVAVGDLRAKLQPEWLRIAGIPLRWRLVAPAIAVASAAAVWLFLVSVGRPAPFNSHLLLWAVVFAANNGFVEEAIFRSALIGSVQIDFGRPQAVAVSAAVFGLAHWNGMPYGITGMLMTFAFGLLAGKAMVETRGIFWPWFMHMLPDVVIYYHWGVGAVQP